MSGRIDKKIRKQMNKKIRLGLEDLARSLSEVSLYWRLVFAFRIIFKYHPEPIKFVRKLT